MNEKKVWTESRSALGVRQRYANDEREEKIYKNINKRIKL